jgi:hypothetical protein
MASGVRPADALAHQEAGKWTMIFPTLTTLRALARYPDVASLETDVLAWRHLPKITAERNRQGMQHPRS